MCHLKMGGQNKVAVLLSCPGRLEMEKGEPAAGTTGKNLNMLLGILNHELGRDDLTRDNITITNAWRHVEFTAGPNRRTEATLQEVTKPENISRLNNELGLITDFVLLCGDRAEAASNSELFCLKSNPKKIYIQHLGGRGLNSIKVDINNEDIISAKKQIAQGQSESINRIQNRNTERRLQVVAKAILEQMRSLA